MFRSVNLSIKLNSINYLRQHVAKISSGRLEHCLDATSGLNSDQIELRYQVRNFIEKELPVQQVQQMDKTSEYHDFRTLWRKMGELGILGVTAPNQYGGLELGYLEHCIVMEEISRVCGAIALSYGAHSNLCVNQICLNGNSTQKNKYLPGLISGKLIGALAMSEPGSGSDVTSMKTTAVPHDDYFILNGSKFWITNGDKADVILVYAKTQADSDQKTGRISAFLVDTNSSGFSIGQKIDKLGMRGSPTSEILFDNVKISKDQLVGQLHGGVYVLMSGLDLERLVLAAGPLGLMQAACEQAFDYAHARKQFGQPIGHFQLLQGKMADMYVNLSSSRTYLYSVARSVDETIKALGPDANLEQKRKALAPFTKDCAAVILHLAELATKTGLDALQIFGGNGFTNEYPLGRIVRDAKLYEIGAGTSEIRRWLIGRELNKIYS